MTRTCLIAWTASLLLTWTNVASARDTEIPPPPGPPTTTQTESDEAAATPEADTPRDDAPEDDAPPVKRPIRPEDYGKWESLAIGFRGSSRLLSPDARWIAYGINRVNDEGELRVRMLATDEVKIYEYARGATFSSDAEWLAFSIGVSEKEREKLQKQKTPVRNKLGLLNLRDGEETEIEDVASFSFSDDGRYLAMRRYPAKEREGDGADLVLRDLGTGVDTNFGNVASYAFNDDGLLLAMVIDAEGMAGNGVQVYDAASGRLRTVDSHDAKYVGLTWREDATDLAVMREMEHDADKDEDVSHTIVAWRGLESDDTQKLVYAHESDEAFPPEMRVTELAGLRWSDDGAALFFGLKEWENKPKALEADDDEDDEEDEDDDDADTKGEEADDEEPEDARPKKRAKGKKADKDGDKPLRETLDKPSNVEVWHADDVDIIPRQKRTANRDERRSHLAALWLDDMRLVPLGDEDLERVTPLEGHKRAIGLDNTPYEEQKRFGPTLHDLYDIDVATGERTKILDAVKYQYTSDPTGRHVLFVRDEDIWSHDLASGENTSLTEALDTPFINQEMSSLTDEKPPYGIGGWAEDGSHVLLYDRFDMYLFTPDGGDVQRLTHGADDFVRHRRVVLDREDDEFVPLDEPMWVSVYGDRSKRSGYAQLTVGDRPQMRRMEPKSVGALTKAEDVESYAWVEQDFDDSPDIFVGDASMESRKQVTETNPFQSDYLWGRSMLLDYESENGDKLQGALFYPAGYEEGTQYPMIVDIYELRSRGVHRYSTPSERSAYNAAVFTAEGYFVYTPDIVYRAQNPGLSAVECVIPAVEAALATGMIDPEGVGLVGHSWGAYQTAFIVTQTDMFAAGVAGAPLTNMMSMSMSIYWNSGQTDAWIFHESQGRMDRPFWQDVETYIKNSPIFSIDEMETPLLIAFGTEDGAVDFNQGVEMYNAARLARKQFVMLVYPEENHGLRRKENQVDYHYRILEWFGHYLKGDEAPAWITEGQTWLDRKKEIEESEKGKKKGGD